MLTIEATIQNRADNRWEWYGFLVNRVVNGSGRRRSNCIGKFLPKNNYSTERVAKNSVEVVASQIGAAIYRITLLQREYDDSGRPVKIIDDRTLYEAEATP